jgi:hypothetical protein
MKRETQCQRLLNLLREHRGHDVDLPLILNLRIASYTRRLTDLRRKGYDIRCSPYRTRDGELRSAYQLVSEPGE